MNLEILRTLEEHFSLKFSTNTSTSILSDKLDVLIKKRVYFSSNMVSEIVFSLQILPVRQNQMNMPNLFKVSDSQISFITLIAFSKRLKKGN